MTVYGGFNKLRDTDFAIAHKDTLLVGQLRIEELYFVIFPEYPAIQPLSGADASNRITYPRMNLKELLLGILSVPSFQ